MSTLRKSRPISLEEYLEGEKYSDVRHEYVAGEVHAMVGASEAHNLIAGALYMALRLHLRGTTCRAFMTDMRLRIGDDFYYPDVLVTCDRLDTEPYFKTRPVLVAEVLSPGTAMRDARDKLAAYQSMDSLREYVLAEQERREIRLHQRTGSAWQTVTCTGAMQIQLTSVDPTLSLDDIYSDVLP